LLVLKTDTVKRGYNGTWL